MLCNNKKYSMLAITLLILGFLHTSHASCSDSTTYFFYQNKNGFPLERKCIWLTAKPNKETYRINKFCKQFVNGSYVRDECVESCNNCPTDAPTASPTTPCADSTTFTFDTYKEGVAISRKCVWLTARKAAFRTAKFCKGDVLTNCPSSCDNC